MIDRLASVAGVVPNQVRIRDIDYFHNSGQPLWTHKNVVYNFE